LTTIMSTKLGQLTSGGGTSPEGKCLDSTRDARSQATKNPINQMGPSSKRPIIEG